MGSPGAVIPACLRRAESIFRRVERAAKRAIRPLSINEILALHQLGETRPGRGVFSQPDGLAGGPAAEPPAVPADVYNKQCAPRSMPEAVGVHGVSTPCISDGRLQGDGRSCTRSILGGDVEGLGSGRGGAASAAPAAGGDPSRLLRCANWARAEIPLRLAHRLHDFSRVPFVVAAQPAVLRVFELYVSAFEQLSEFPDRLSTAAEAAAFTASLRHAVREHAEIVVLMQRGVAQLRRDHPGLELDGFLDRLFGTRLGNRVLAETTLAVAGAEPHGAIQRDCHPAALLRAVAAAVRGLAASAYPGARCPEVRIVGDLDLKFAFVPEHLRFVCTEILKNAVRATVEAHRGAGAVGSAGSAGGAGGAFGAAGGSSYGATATGLEVLGAPSSAFGAAGSAFGAAGNEFGAPSSAFGAAGNAQSAPGSAFTPPPVTVGVHKGQSHVVIKVSDEGGGVPEELHSQIWRYGFSTAPSAPGAATLGGYGFGLPLSRLYTRYLGGDLDIKFMYGHGSDAYIFLPRLGHQRENEEVLNAAVDAV